MLKESNMKKIIFTMVMGFCMVSAYAQLKVVSSGDLIVGETNNTPGGILDLRKSAGAADLLMRMWNTGSGGSKLRYVCGNSARSELQLTTLAEWLAGVSATGAGGLQFHVRQTGSTNNEATLRSQVKMVIDRDGQIGIGTTAPSFLLHVNGAAAKPGGGSWTDAASDRRLKKNIHEFSDGLETVLKLNPVWYQFNEQLADYDNGKEYVGLIAQEVQEVAPYMIENLNYHEYETSGQSEADYQINKVNEKSFLTLNNTAITYMLVNAIKEQQEQLEEKEDRIAELEEKLVNLADKVEDILNERDVNLGGLSDAGSLGQNNPNPFQGETEIPYFIPKNSSNAKINIFDSSGRLIKSVDIDHTGRGKLNVNATSLPSGTYTYQLLIDNQIVKSKRMVAQ